MYTPQQTGFEAGGGDHRLSTSFIFWLSSAVKLRRLVYSSSVRPIFSKTESVNTFLRMRLLRVLLRMLYPKRQHNHFLVIIKGLSIHDYWFSLSIYCPGRCATAARSLRQLRCVSLQDDNGGKIMLVKVKRCGINPKYLDSKTMPYPTGCIC